VLWGPNGGLRVTGPRRKGTEGVVGVVRLREHERQRFSDLAVCQGSFTLRLSRLGFSRAAEPKMTRPSLADLRADARREPLWIKLLTGTWLLAFLVAVHQLADPDLVGSARALWAIVPVPFVLISMWAWKTLKARFSELEHAVLLEASYFAFRASLYLIFTCALLDAALGLPLSITVLGDTSVLGWNEAAFATLVFFLIGWVRAYSRIFPRK